MSLGAQNSFYVTVFESNSPPVLRNVADQTVAELTTLTVTNTATNANIHSTIVGYGLVNPPVGATIGANGVITWTPSQDQSPSTNTLTTVVTNSNPYDLFNPLLTATNSFTVVVREVNVAPALPVIPTHTVNELTLLTVTNTASNPNIHSIIVGYGLVNPPAGATIGVNGVITWTPSQDQSPSTNTLTTVMTNSDPYDLLNPVLTAGNSFTVVVREVNVAPTLPVIPAQTVDAFTLLTVTNTATNANIHSTIVGYGLVNPPAGATIDTNGVITWTPSQNQSASTNTIATVVTNSNPYDLVSPQLTATNSFTVTVNPALIVTANNQTRSYGAANPTLTGTLVGMQSGDNITPVFSTTADTNSPVGSYTIAAALLDPDQKLGKYTVITNNGALAVTPATLTIAADPKARAYGVPNPVFTASYNGFVNAETTNVLGGSPSLTTLATQVSPIGNYAITAGPGSLSATNYSFSFVDGNLTIAPAQLTVSGITASNKPYDGTSVAAIQTAGAVLQGAVPGDDVTLNTASASGAFSDPAIGTGKTVFISGLTLGGSSITNYSLLQPTATADITPRGLTVTGIVAVSKVYDGSTNAPLILTNAALAGVGSGEDVRLDTNNAVGAFADPTAGTNKTVTVSGLALFGADAGKYTLAQPTTNADITPAALTPSVTVASKVYDATPAATITGRSLSGIVGSDDVSLGSSGTAAFADKNAGTNKTVNVTSLSLSGSAATNYVLSATNATASADITPLPITVTADPKTKVFGEPDPVLTYQVSSGSLVGGDFFFGFLTRSPGENVGTYAALQNNLTAGSNYRITFVSADLTITTGNSTLTLVSTLNPAAPGAIVTIMADLSPIAPNGLRPTGSVQFYLNAAAYGGPMPIISGGAGFSTAGLPAGTNVIRATYSGDSNCVGSTNSLVQLVDPSAFRPVALGITLSKSGTVTVTFSGAPGSNYVVQACGGVAEPDWQNVSTNTADAQGQWTFSETPGGLQSRSYRAVAP